MNDSCKACRFWHWQPDNVGECRRHAPSPTLILQSSDLPVPVPRIPVWPTTFAQDWCGAFQPHAVQQVKQPDLRQTLFELIATCEALEQNNSKKVFDLFRKRVAEAREKAGAV